MTSAAQQAVADELRQILAQVTESAALRAIPLDFPLLQAGAGLDSLTATLLLRKVHRQFAVDVAREDLNLSCLATLGTLAEFIEQRIAGRADPVPLTGPASPPGMTGPAEPANGKG
ncbi:MAG TPA: acyl carrier protein [Streptosporangiaceae bacterium]|nr:acyl carrier protein [Streptosporangiaceae bacterium]